MEGHGFFKGIWWSISHQGHVVMIRVLLLYSLYTLTTYIVLYIHIIHICTYTCMFKNLNDGQGETVNVSA